MAHDMFQGHIGGPAFVEEGALYTGKGKYSLFVLGAAKNPKELTARTVIVAVAVVLAIILVATFLAGKEPAVIPYQMKLYNALGHPLDSALVNSGLKTAKLTKTSDDAYTVEEDIKVDGIVFELQLFVDDGVLSGFSYTTAYEADTKKAAKDIYNILVDLHIDSVTLEDGAEPIEVDKKAFRNYLEERKDLLIKDEVNVTPSELVGALKRYFEALETSENWEGKVHGYLVRQAQVYMDSSVAYEQQTNIVKMQISYQVDAERPATPAQ